MTGHIPEAVGLVAEKIVYATVGVRNPDTLQATRIAREIAAAGVRVSPTLAAQKALALARTKAYATWLAAPTMQYVDSGTLAWWRSLAPRDSNAPLDNTGRRSAAVHTFQRVLTRELFRAGVPLLIGTDAPNPLM